MRESLCERVQELVRVRERVRECARLCERETLREDVTGCDRVRQSVRDNDGRTR